MGAFDLNRFLWRKDKDVAGRFVREPVGGELIEDIWNLIHHGEQNLFLGVYADMSIPLDTPSLMTHVRDAWKTLRWEQPIIAAQILHVPEENRPLPRSYMTYDVATSEEDVDKWAETTVILQEGFKDLDDLRYTIGQDPVPPKDLAPQTFIHITPFSPTSFGILFHTSHVPFDGGGVKILMTKLLTHLSRYIADPQLRDTQFQSMRWGEEASRLLPPISSIIQRPEPAVKDAGGNIIKPAVQGEPLDDALYTKTLTEILQGLANGARAHPFKSFIEPPFDIQRQKPLTRRLQHVFSVEESAKIKAAGAPSEFMPEKFTVNHLVHGALSLLPILDNPPPEDSDAVVFYYGLVDARRRLAASYRGPHDYAGYTLGMSAIQVPVSLYHRFSSADRRTLVLEFSKVIREHYTYQRECPCLLTVGAEQVETMMQGPPPPAWCGPWYAADGRGSVYLTPEYSVNGKRIIEINDFFLGLNKCDPGPFFRAYEWKGKLILSVDFNELAVKTEVVQGWMKLWADLLLEL